MNSTVGDDILPHSARIAREAAICSGVRPRVSSTAVRILGPPGWTIQLRMSFSSQTVAIEPLLKPNPKVASNQSWHSL